jgi:anti-anti-sigma regulatory factor
MAEGDNRSGSLLAKVAKFVRNPTKDWSELDEKDSVQDSGYSREALKEMIERKRQNDFVRKREFDHLRKLRRREPLTGGDPAGRPSFFQSSISSNQDDRAQTLKKIDEIEAQMSRQWWKSKQGDVGTAAGGDFPRAAPPRPDAGPTLPPSEAALGRVASDATPQEDSQFESTVASGLRPHSSQWVEPQAGHVPTQLVDAASTVPGHVPATAPPTPAAAHPGAAGTVGAAPPGAPRLPVGVGFSTQRLYAAAPADSLTDPELEEAAIRFANGDDAGAEQSLLHALQGSNLRPDQAETWMAAVFDLYRATGQQARFDSVALEFARRFGRSPPAWFSMPELLGRRNAAAAPPARPVGEEPDWRSPALLTAAALQELQPLLEVPGALALDWSALHTVHPDAVPLLAQLVARWAATPAVLQFRGHGALERALAALTPSGDRSVDTLCWQLRMDALRIMRRQDEFELVALDYCVTYEVSPPSWQEPRCSCELQDMHDPAALAEESVRSGWEQPHSVWDDPLAHLTVPIGLDEAPPAVVELYGEIVGDAAEVLAKLEKGMEGGTRMVVSCARLIRVDFTAAGSILNWVAEQQAKGCQVQFRDVNRMVAAFFNVIGITEYARVIPRVG